MNKRIIFMAVSTFLVLLLIVLFAGVFVVKHIEFAPAEDGLTFDADKLAEGSRIKRNSSIFSLDEDIAANNIEITNPYIRVNKVERFFPNTVRIGISGRTPILCVQIKDKDKYLILDSDLKILEQVDKVKLENFTVCKVEGYTIHEPNEGVLTGSFLITQDKYLASVKEVIAGAADISFTNERFPSLIVGIGFKSNSNYIEMKTNTGVKFAVRTDSNMTVSAQVRAAYSYYDTVMTDEERRMDVYLVLSEEGWEKMNVLP